jgi:hypothetical protein
MTIKMKKKYWIWNIGFFILLYTYIIIGISPNRLLSEQSLAMIQVLLGEVSTVLWGPYIEGVVGELGMEAKLGLGRIIGSHIKKDLKS